MTALGAVGSSSPLRASRPASEEAVAQERLPLIELSMGPGLASSAVFAARELVADALRLRPAQLVINLSGSSHICAEGVSVLLEAHRTLWRRGDRLVLKACGPEMRRLLALAGVLNVFLYDDGLTGVEGRS